MVIAAASLLTIFVLALMSCSKQSNPVLNSPGPAPTGVFRNLDVHGSVTVILKSDTVNKMDSTLSGVVNYNYKGQTLSLTGSGVAVISIKQLDALTVTGSADVSSTDTLRMDSLLITSHGSSKINLKLVVKNKTSIAVTGSSDNYVLAGKCPKFNLDVKGSPEIHTYSFLTNDCSVVMNGSGNCEVYSSKSLSVDLRGSCILYYKGNPPAVTQIAIIGSAQLIKQ